MSCVLRAAGVARRAGPGGGAAPPASTCATTSLDAEGLDFEDEAATCAESASVWGPAAPPALPAAAVAILRTRKNLAQLMRPVDLASRAEKSCWMVDSGTITPAS